MLQHRKKDLIEKHDPSYPYNAIKFVLEYVDLKLSDIDKTVFRKPFEIWKIIRNLCCLCTKGFCLFFKSNAIMDAKAFRKPFIQKAEVSRWKYKSDENIFFSDHHLSHAAVLFTHLLLKKQLYWLQMEWVNGQQLPKHWKVII